MKEVNEIVSDLKVILENHHGAEDIEMESSFKNDFGMDSLDVREYLYGKV